MPTDGPTQRQPDISIARKRLKWKPAISLNEGLEKTITYFENLLGKEKHERKA
jgi:UDP-glucuronate decarboxylase